MSASNNASAAARECDPAHHPLGQTIDASTGAYVAKANPFVTDVVSLTDSVGNSTTATVAVSGNNFTVGVGAHTLDTDAMTYDGSPVVGLSGARSSTGNTRAAAVRHTGAACSSHHRIP